MIKALLCWLGYHGHCIYNGAFTEIVKRSTGKYRIKYYDYTCTNCNKNHRVIIKETRL